jgi:hypothetical protein
LLYSGLFVANTKRTGHLNKGVHGQMTKQWDENHKKERHNLCTSCQNEKAVHYCQAGNLCDDCYFDILGEEVEKHPLHRPKREDKW